MEIVSFLEALGKIIDQNFQTFVQAQAESIGSDLHVFNVMLAVG